MSQVPLTVNIGLQNLVTLLNYYWASVNSKDVGDLGNKTYEETVIDLDRQCSLKISPEQLETLVYHAKQSIFERLKPIKVEHLPRNYHSLMRNLKEEVPQLFKTLNSGEIVFINFKEREHR